MTILNRTKVYLNFLFLNECYLANTTLKTLGTVDEGPGAQLLPKSNRSNGKLINALLVIAATTLIVSCNSIEVDPPNFLISDAAVFSDDNTAESAVSGIYSEMISTTRFASGGAQSITFLSGLSADEFAHFSLDVNQGEFFDNSLTDTNPTIEFGLWNEAYKFIFSANSILEGLNQSTTVSDETKQRLEGEVKFIRAFCYFYLTNLFGDVPLATTTDFVVNSDIPRSSSEEIYVLIINDLIDAKKLLPADYSLYADERLRPNSFTASALLARVYLFTEQWVLAEAEASNSISNSALYSLEDNLDVVFLKNSNEAIWQLMPVVPGLNTWEGTQFILNFTPGSVALDNDLVNAFEAGDIRKSSWVNTFSADDVTYYYPFKYKIQFDGNVSEYSMVLRLAEQYLIRAEARVQQGNILGSQSDLNIIRNRAGLPNTMGNDKTSLLASIVQERRLELFTEWGHRWFDLKRTGNAAEVLNAVKPEWQDSDVLYPIPRKELQNNPNLTQNPGY